jgi:glycosyltransferase involved in cell wall biosynthesis
MPRPPGERRRGGSRRRRVVFRAPINAFTGYGLYAENIVRGLAGLRHEVVVRPAVIDEKFGRIGQLTRRRIVHEVQPEEWELLLFPPNAPVTAGKRTIYSTMWETDRLSSEQVASLNAAECVIVPCAWNKACFAASGVTSPIRVVPLGIDPKVFGASPMEMTGPCVFGAAGRLQSCGQRKGLAHVIELFRQAFPTEQDVELRVKAFPDCPLTSPPDARIRVDREYLSPSALARWFSGLTCFVSAARAEGWGLMQHEALAAGRPLIAARFAGLAEFFDPAMGYPVAYEMVPADGQFEGLGLWARPNDAEIVAAMRAVYADRAEARRRGQAGAAGVKRFSTRHSVERLTEVLREFDVLPPKPMR